MEQEVARSVLEDLSRTPGIIGCSLIDRESGRVIHRICPFKDKMSEEDLAAIITTIYTATDIVNSELDMGPAEMVHVEFPKSYLLIVRVGDVLLSAFTDKNVPLGRVRFEILKAARKMANTSGSQTEESSTEVSEKTEEVRVDDSSKQL